MTQWGQLLEVFKAELAKPPAPPKTAVQYYEALRRIPYHVTDDGQQDGRKDIRQWREAVEEACALAVHVDHGEMPFETGALDPSWVLTFADASVLEIHNPKQHSFGGFAYILEA